MKQQFTCGGYEPKCLSGFQHNLVLIPTLERPSPVVGSIVSSLKKTISLHLFGTHKNGRPEIASQLVNTVDDKGLIS